MVRRCTKPDHQRAKDYFLRGIRVCQEWIDSFESYLAYIQSIGFTGAAGQSLDRIDNDGNYEPGNLRVTDAKTQRRNSRLVHSITAFGQTRILVEWAELTGISSKTIATRLNVLHWTPERALTEPIGKSQLKTAAADA